jgi:hypothetical protein
MHDAVFTIEPTRMQPYATILSLALLLLGCRGPAATPIAAPDDGLGEALRTLVVKSLVGGEVGYLVHVRRTPQPSGALQLEVTVSCSYVFRGNVRPFAQGGTWELRRLGDRWHIVGSLGEWIT